MNTLRLATILGILAIQNFSISGVLNSQETPSAGHEHLTGVQCIEVPAGQKRPEFGCFAIASTKALQFPQSQVYWHLITFPNRAAAEAEKSSTGIVVEEDGRVWLSEFGPRNRSAKGGQPVAVVGPLELLPATAYTVDLFYAVMQPGDRSRVHTHPGPEAWYMIAGEQCLETPAGAIRAKTGETMSVPPNVPMELSITGTEVRRSLALVIHDSGQPWGLASQWQPTGTCRR